MQVHSFTFSPFDENTYVLQDDSMQCIIIDPGCYYPYEQNELKTFILDSGLTAVMLINTHGHIDHIFGNKFVCDTFQLLPHTHQNTVPLLLNAEAYGKMFGVSVESSPLPTTYLKEHDMVSFGNSILKVIYTPGHSNDSISLYSEEEKFIISGDVLFHQSIGRTDLPGGDYDTLIATIRQKLFSLPDDVIVYSGHGPSTTIGFEKANNPFFR